MCAGKSEGTATASVEPTNDADDSQQSQPHLNASGFGFCRGDAHRTLAILTALAVLVDKRNKLQYYFIYTNIFLCISE